MMAFGRVSRAGLVATNSIRGGKSRVVIDRIVGESMIYDAWADEPVQCSPSVAHRCPRRA